MDRAGKFTDRHVAAFLLLPYHNAAPAVNTTHRPAGDRLTAGMCSAGNHAMRRVHSEHGRPVVLKEHGVQDAGLDKCQMQFVVQH